MQEKHAQKGLANGLGSLARSARCSLQRDVGAPQPKTVLGVCKTRGTQKRPEATAPIVCPDLATLHWFWNETRNRLESLRHRVREGADLMEAADFCRYVLNSGLLKILAPFDTQAPLKIDSAFLRWSAEDLLREVQVLWRAGKIVPGANVAQNEAILHRLDLIAGQVAKLSGGQRQEPGFVPSVVPFPADVSNNGTQLGAALGARSATGAAP
jgi:hypothetical protein